MSILVIGFLFLLTIGLPLYITLFGISSSLYLTTNNLPLVSMTVSFQKLQGQEFVAAIPLFIFAGAPSPVWLTAKLSVPVVENKFNLGAGVLAGTVVGVNSGSFGILYGVSTFGSRDQNLTVGLGWGFADGQMAKDPTVNVSGMIRTGPRGYLITENYFIGTANNYMILLSLGGRRIINHVGLDFGAFVPIGKDVDTFIVIPWLGFTIPFGK